MLGDLTSLCTVLMKRSRDTQPFHNWVLKSITKRTVLNETGLPVGSIDLLGTLGEWFVPAIPVVAPLVSCLPPATLGNADFCRETGNSPQVKICKGA